MIEAPIKSLRVAAFDVRIRVYDRLAAIGDQRYGSFSGVEQLITVDLAVRPQKVLDTLLHEISHAIFWAYGIEDADKEERIVSALGTAWAQVYRDNPGLLPWISDLVEAAKADA